MDVTTYLAKSSAAAAGLSERPGAVAVEKAAGLIADALAAGGQVLFCGNGGSAADAQHLAAELVGQLGLGLERPGYRAVALTTDTSALTAIGNDFGFERLFERQVGALGRPGDVLVVLSTSGRSPNIVRAAAAARDRGLRVIALLGPAGSAVDAHADLTLRVPGEAPGIIQQGHITVGHALCAEIEQLLSAGRSAPPAAGPGS